MDANEVSVKREMSLQQAISYLEDIVKTLKEGRVVFERGEESVVLTPPSGVTVQVKAKKKDDKESVSLKIGWRQIEPEAEGEEDGSLQIHAGKEAKEAKADKA